MSNLDGLLAKLSTDAELKDQFIADPESIMDAENLTDDEKAAMLDGDVDKLSDISGDNQVYGKNVVSLD
ncbi:hypothetical protein [Shewanella surugensis]|uniref:Extradiol ring-cleavage dioxygenase LigAB LigA subunit domain-containing protein n=1 Tax=Shewanella surugensis TaxID=212020 RepID=A0ABT0L741_9GAMM|nr:hypothetical protein [Shewanella surugensis]MCL1123509.1 hypothetical protein [Shewanella surugensis]